MTMIYKFRTYEERKGKIPWSVFLKKMSCVCLCVDFDGRF